MREILFRGFTPDENGKEKVFVNGKWITGQWVYGYLCKDRFKTPDNKFILMLCISYEEKGVLYCSKIIPETVGQYTGLTDKNGKKIFEGDILKYFDCVDKDKYFCEVVEFINGVFRSANNTDSHILGYAYCSCSELIGNIYYNPELYENSKQLEV